MIPPETPPPLPPAAAAAPALRAGRVRVEGLLEGPASSWDPAPAEVAAALERAGCPPALLQVAAEGGRRLLEPADPPGRGQDWPAAAFSGDPGRALGEALRDLLETAGGRPRGWDSSLRLLQEGGGRLRETLYRPVPEGIRALSRERAAPPPAPDPRRRRRRLWTAAILTAAAVLLVAANWRRLDAETWRFRYRFGLHDLESRPPEVDPGPFAPFVVLDFAPAVPNGEWRLEIAPAPGFPQTAEDRERVRAEADLATSGALAALELGRARIRIQVEGGKELREIPVHLGSLARGAPAIVRIHPGLLGGRPLRLELVP